METTDMVKTYFSEGIFSLELDGKLKEYEYCLFDFDGTILDTEKYHYDTWNCIFDKYGVHITQEEYIPLKSSGREHIIDVICKSHNLSLNEEQIKKAVNDKGKIYLELSKNISESDLVPGAVDFLKKLKEFHVKTAIASAGKNLWHMLKRFDLDKFFDSVVDGNGPNRPKPFPDIFINAANNLNAIKPKTIVFEDSFPGIDGAVAGGFDVVGIGGINSPKAIKNLSNYINLIGD